MNIHARMAYIRIEKKKKKRWMYSFFCCCCLFENPNIDLHHSPIEMLSTIFAQL